MRILTYIVVIVVAIAATLFYVSRKLPDVGADTARLELVHLSQTVEKEIREVAYQLQHQLDGLGDVISADRDFAMKLLVEKDTMSTEVTETAPRFIQVMGLDLLEITDAGNTVLSSGHFSAGAGATSEVTIEALGAEESAFLRQYLRGDSVLTFQARVRFECAGVPFYATGGYTVDEGFLDRISPAGSARLLLNHENTIIGMSGIETISEIQDGKMIINDISYLASEVPFPDNVEGGPVNLVLIMDEPGSLSWTSLL